MNVFVLVLGLMTGEVSAVEAEQYLSAQPVQTVAYAAPTDTRQMTDDQLEQVYMTPEGWVRDIANIVADSSSTAGCPITKIRYIASSTFGNRCIGMVFTYGASVFILQFRD